VVVNYWRLLRLHSLHFLIIWKS